MSNRYWYSSYTCLYGWGNDNSFVFYIIYGNFGMAFRALLYICYSDDLLFSFIDCGKLFVFEVKYDET